MSARADLSVLQAARPDAPLGVLDIGSNSIRLVAYSGQARTPVPIYNERAFCRLGASVAKSGAIAGKPAEMALAALRRFRAIAARLHISHLIAFGTAAMREADNRAAFLAEAQAILGSDIRILSGEEEARYSALGVMMSFPKANGVVADLGGGSLELARVQEGNISAWATLPVGVLALRQMQKGGVNIRTMLDSALAELDWLAIDERDALYMVGGTWRALARLHMERCNYALDVLHHYAMDIAEARHFTRHVSLLDGDASDMLASVASLRRPALPHAALVLNRLLKAQRPKRLYVSAFGVREGALAALSKPEYLQLDPLLLACEAMGARLCKSPDYGRELVQWTAELFIGEKLAEEVERYRHAACLVSDMAWDCHVSNRAQMISNHILRAPFMGLDHSGRIFMAHALAHRHEMSDGVPILHGVPLPLRYESLSRALGCAFRLAHALSASLPGLLPQTRLRRRNRLVLELPAAHADLNAPIIDKRLRLTAEALGLRHRVEIMS